MKLNFLGGVGTVTGSKTLVQAGDARLLVDCGLFQGYKVLRERNWAPPTFSPRSIDAVVLTHAHLDHSGYIPLLIKQGFAGPVLCTSATRDLCEILLRDSGFLQERDAEYANRKGFSKHRPALPLYTEAEAMASLGRFRTVHFSEDYPVKPGLTLRFTRVGHILGAASVHVRSAKTSIVFSGDIGRPANPIMAAPERPPRADYLVAESTYGDRLHSTEDPETLLASTINTTLAHGGTVLIPAFAVGRAQELLFHLHRLRETKRIPAHWPVFLDSPMAANASGVLRAHPNDHRLSAAECRDACEVAKYVRDAEESRRLSENPLPKIVLSASGMATGGRVLHHLKHLLPDSRNTILFTGFQAGGTRGASLVAGETRVKIHGAYIPVRAKVLNLAMLSAHADAAETIDWLRKFEQPPKMTFINHGEPAAADALRRRIAEELGWPARVAEERTEIDLA
ncbi:MAG: MBL fold metallo-hydrolase RNA specificity domain-containing protein [Burkholderiales bacterium]